MLHSIGKQIWNTQQWPQDWKRLDFIPIPKKGNTKECSNFHTIAVISHACKVMLKILQAKFQQYVNWELPDAQAGFRKGRGTRDQIANIRWIIEKAREFQKSIYVCFIHCTKTFDYVDHNKLWKILFFSSFIFISWRLITLQYWSGFCHILTWISHGFTCIPHSDPPSHLPLHPIPLGLPSAPAPSTCLMHPAWAGDLFHPY